MANSELIVQLYEDVLNKQKSRFNVSPSQIVDGIKEIGEAYSPDLNWECKLNSSSAYYEGAADRCAYLHKYAMVHTGLFWDLLQQALKVHSVKEAFGMHRDADSLRLCSLGSGPGTDLVACLFLLKERFENKRTRATLVDCCDGWKWVFEDIVSELKKPKYVGDVASNRNFQYEYVVADLLEFDGCPSPLTRNITSADVVTMVKFVSAAACRDTRKMMEKIIEIMKPGSMLLFVDNAAGGFDSMIRQIADDFGLQTVFGPMNHYDYENPFLALERHGHTSQFKTRVSIQMWKKPAPSSYNATAQLRHEFFNGYRPESRRLPDRENIYVVNDRQHPPEEGCCSII